MSGPFPGNDPPTYGATGAPGVVVSPQPGGFGAYPINVEFTDDDTRDALHMNQLAECNARKINWLTWRTVDWISGGDYSADQGVVTLGVTLTIAPASASTAVNIIASPGGNGVALHAVGGDTGTGGIGVFGVVPSGNGLGGRFTGNGTGSSAGGVLGFGGTGASSGPGVSGLGGATNGIGVVGQGQGTAAGVNGTGGINAGIGVSGQGGTGGTGNGGIGVQGIGGSGANGIGVVGQGGTGAKGGAFAPGAGETVALECDGEFVRTGPARLRVSTLGTTSGTVTVDGSLQDVLEVTGTGGGLTISLSTPAHPLRTTIRFLAASSAQVIVKDASGAATLATFTPGGGAFGAIAVISNGTHWFTEAFAANGAVGAVAVSS